MNPEAGFLVVAGVAAGLAWVQARAQRLPWRSVWLAWTLPAALLAVMLGMEVLTMPKTKAALKAKPDAAPCVGAYPELVSAVAAMRARDYKAALENLEKATEDTACPDRAFATALLAECLYYLGEDADALAACARATMLEANCWRAAHVRGLVLRRQGREADAREAFRLAAVWGNPASLAGLRDKP